MKDRVEKKNKRQAYKPIPPFKTVEGVGTQPFKKLSPHAVYVLLRFYEKFSGFNRNDLSLTYAGVRDVMSNLLYSRAIWQLIGFGFLDVKRFGRLQANCSLFSLSNRWRGFENDPKRCEKIQRILDEVELLKRQAGSTEKRMRIRQLRNSLFEV